MFVGREKELAELNRLYETDTFEMPVIYGRRRVGKTRLISEFIRGKRAIYVQARRTNAQANLRMLSDAIFAFSEGPSGGAFESFDDAFDALAQLSQAQRLVFVIDEYPYLAQSSPEISSLLQEKIDHVYKQNTKLKLVLCGSSLSFMEEQVLGYESPLYGRRTAQFKINPLDFFTAKHCWPQASETDAAVYYGITGGIPAYAEKIDSSLSLKQNIERLYLTPSGYLFEEPGNLLLQECRNPAQYDSIITAVASGKTRLNEIATTAKITESNTSTYLAKLSSLGIIRRELPFGESSNKRAIYCVDDSMFRFWYKFVPQSMGLIQNEMGDLAMKRIEPHIPEFMGAVFEKICSQYIYRLARLGKVPVMPIRMGRWWGSDPRTKSQEEIDIVFDDSDGNACFAECKWRNEQVGSDILDTLVFRSELFRYSKRHYMVFSKSGFTDACHTKAQAMDNVTLISFKDMVRE